MKIDSFNRTKRRIRLAYAVMILFAGCHGRRLPAFRAEVDFIREEPQWVFEEQGLRTYEGRKVILAVGGDAHALDYRSRYQNALNKGRKQLETDLQAHYKRLSKKILAEIDVPENSAEVLRDILRSCAKKISTELAMETEPDSVHESLLRQEVLIKLLIPLEKATTRYLETARNRLETHLREKLDEIELEELLDELELLEG